MGFCFRVTFPSPTLRRENTTKKSFSEYKAHFYHPMPQIFPYQPVVKTPPGGTFTTLQDWGKGLACVTTQPSIYRKRLIVK